MVTEESKEVRFRLEPAIEAGKVMLIKKMKGYRMSRVWELVECEGG